MADYIQIAIDARKPKYLRVEVDNTVSLETLRSAFPRACGLCFEIENKCFVVKLHRGIFYPPRNWRKFCYEPIIDDVEYDDGDDDYGHENDDQSDHGEEYDYYDKDKDDGYHDDNYYEDRYHDDHTEDNGYNGHAQYNAPEKEDINDLYFNMVREKHEEELHNEESDYDD